MAWMRSVRSAFSGAASAIWRPTTGVEIDSVERMYEVSKRKAWDESTIIDWDRPFDVPESERDALTMMMGYLYYGERAAFALASEMIARVPHEEARKLLAMQTADEARHMSALGRVVGSLGRMPAADPFQRAFIASLLLEPGVPIKMFGLQLISENVANQVFVHLKPRLTDERLVTLVGAIQADESRHVGLGSVYLPHLLKEASPWLIVRMHMWFGLWAGLFLGSMYYQRDVIRRLDIDVESALEHVLRDYRRVIKAMEKETGRKVPILFPLGAVERIGKWALRTVAATA